jgi:pyroglutamyl-peptidase
MMLKKTDTRPTVLLTGFGPFPGVPANASAEVVRRVVRRARRTFPELRFVAAVLPTEWRRAPRLVAALHERYRPVLALHFGVASETRSIRLETQAENVCRASPDAAGMLPTEASLCPDGPAKRHVTLDISALAEALEAGGWPCSISNDAGGYLCNAVLYKSLASADGRCAVGFVHIPADLSGPPLGREETVAAALTIIEVALGKADTTAAPSA